MGLLRQKRGVTAVETMLLVAFEIFLILMVGASLMYYASKIKDDTLFQRIHHSKDISFLIEAMQSVPGNVIYDYNESFGFDYDFSKNVVEVHEPELKMTTLTSVYYLFAEDINLNFIYPKDVISATTKKETQLSFKKTGDFEINPVDKNIDFRVCPLLKTTGNSVMLEGPDTLRGYLLGLGITEGNSEASPLIILKYSYVNDVEIYITKDISAMKLACMVSNELKKAGINSVILPSEISEMKNEVSLLIKANNVLSGSIEKPIAEGVKRYFEWDEINMD